MCFRIAKPAISRVGSGGWPGLVGIDRPEPLLQKPPIDLPPELRQRVVQVDDLIEPRAKRSSCPLSRRSLGRIESPSA